MNATLMTPAMMRDRLKTPAEDRYWQCLSCDWRGETTDAVEACPKCGGEVQEEFGDSEYEYCCTECDYSISTSEIESECPDCGARMRQF